jgi:hypothetical protein
MLHFDCSTELMVRVAEVMLPVGGALGDVTPRRGLGGEVLPLGGVLVEDIVVV